MNMWRELEEPEPEKTELPAIDFEDRFRELHLKLTETKSLLWGLFFFSIGSFLLLFTGLCLLLKIVSDFDSQLFHLFMKSV